ncbi:hypothetical protein SUGI_0761080 [Cryptomeria japonica]|nr:hypothetical protein SUGI_0761080 [Cryptomeria japonica]
MEPSQKNVLVPIAYDSEGSKIVALIDVFRYADAHVTVASVEGDLQVVCLNNVRISKKMCEDGEGLTNRKDKVYKSARKATSN